MTFEEKLKLRARTEDCPLPQGFPERLEEKIDEIVEKAERPGKKRVFRTALLAAALCAALTATALAASPTLRQALLAALGSFAPYSQEMEGLSAVDQGIEVRVVSALTDGTVVRVYFEIRDLTEDRLNEALKVEWENVTPDDRASWEQWGYGSGRLVSYDPDSRTALMEFALAGDGQPVEDTVLTLEINRIIPWEANWLREKEPIEGKWLLNVPLTSAPSRRVELGGAAIGKAKAETLRLTALGAYLETVPTITLRSRRGGIRRWPLTVSFSDGTTIAVAEADSLYQGYERETYHWSFPEPIDLEKAVGVEINGQYFSLAND